VKETRESERNRESVLKRKSVRVCERERERKSERRKARERESVRREGEKVCFHSTSQSTTLRNLKIVLLP